MGTALIWVLFLLITTTRKAMLWKLYGKTVEQGPGPQVTASTQVQSASSPKDSDCCTVEALLKEAVASAGLWAPFPVCHCVLCLLLLD